MMLRDVIDDVRGYRAMPRYSRVPHKLQTPNVASLLYRNLIRFRVGFSDNIFCKFAWDESRVPWNSTTQNIHLVP